jgi:hypothetical protein
LRVIVTGSRNWDDKPGAWGNQTGIVERALDSLMEAAEFYNRPNEITLVHGDCPDSPDRLADKAARDLGWTVETHPADWDFYGKQAGFIRNQEMVDLGADLCMAFLALCIKPKCGHYPHYSHGASHCADAAERAGIMVWRYEQP